MDTTEIDILQDMEISTVIEFGVYIHHIINGICFFQVILPSKNDNEVYRRPWYIEIFLTEMKDHAIWNEQKYREHLKRFCYLFTMMLSILSQRIVLYLKSAVNGQKIEISIKSFKLETLKEQIINNEVTYRKPSFLLDSKMKGKRVPEGGQGFTIPIPFRQKEG